jgi:hypothetical protein
LWIGVLALADEDVGERGGGGESAFKETKSLDGEQAKLFATLDRKGARKLGDEVGPVGIDLGRIHFQLKEMGQEKNKKKISIFANIPILSECAVTTR